MDQYIEKLLQLEEDLSGLMSENLGLEKDYIKKAFSGNDGPAMGTKVAKYPQCPNPELVRGLREHTDAGGIILLLQENQVLGLELSKDGKWVEIPPSKNNVIFVNRQVITAMEIIWSFLEKPSLVITDKGPRFESIKNMVNGDYNLVP
ncbi:1-aminocyclopropane-1-carboxylate oxidase 1-like [Lotus japonicus]|uniref:1-aminocyclopropane-1-carboxylate oxidase 1-like n=1 Tax=Lotus japonicus TaxID=34305 RepID=UPI00258C848E|nr:1-aminocyclopropane-1-carboxylate oxidase 1-like [Lotus japonicus]